MANPNAEEIVDDDDDDDTEEEEEEDPVDRLIREAREETERLIREKRESFFAALTLCGITTQSVLHYLEDEQNLVNIDELADLSISELEVMIALVNKTANPNPINRRGVRRAGPNLVITAVSTKRLKSLREWIKWQIACNKSYDARLFNREWMKWTIDRMDYEARLVIADDTSAPKPGALNSVGFAAWHPFWRQLISYLGTIRGTLNIPLSYIIRDTPIPGINLFSDTYDSSDEALIDCVALSGTYYREDNAKVWAILESCTLPSSTNKGNAWPFISSFSRKKDGRGAILALRGQAEGAASMESRKSIAYKIKDTVRYDGKGQFKFDHYIEQLQFAFSELEECGDPQSESHKLHTLRTGCTSDAMKTAKEWVNDMERYPTFLSGCEYLQGYIGRNMPEVAIARRNISYTDSSGTTTSGTNDDYSDLQDNYSQSEWHQLSEDTRTRVKARNARKKTSLKKMKKTATNLAKAKRRIQELKTRLNDPSDSDNDDASDTTAVTKVSAAKTEPSRKKT